MYPDRYPTRILTEWQIVPVIHLTELSLEHIGDFHSKTIQCEKINGRFWYPVLLSFTTVPMLRYRHSRILLRKEWELCVVWPNVIQGWAVDPRNRTVAFLGICQEGVSKV